MQGNNDYDDTIAAPEAPAERESVSLSTPPQRNHRESNSPGTTDMDSETFMYTCGQNSYGELGQRHTEERFFPEKVDFMVGRNIVCVAAGNEHTAVLTDTGEVFTCGYNDSGQCGVGTVGRVNVLRRVEALEGKGVVKLVSSNGCEHLIAVTEDGQAYSCGYNARGQLGGQ